MQKGGLLDFRGCKICSSFRVFKLKVFLTCIFMLVFGKRLFVRLVDVDVNGTVAPWSSGLYGGGRGNVEYPGIGTSAGKFRGIGDIQKLF